MNNRLVFFSVLVLGLLLAGIAGWSFDKQGEVHLLFPLGLLISLLCGAMLVLMLINASDVKIMRDPRPEHYKVQDIGPEKEGVRFIFVKDQKGRNFSLFVDNDKVPMPGSIFMLRKK